MERTFVRCSLVTIMYQKHYLSVNGTHHFKLFELIFAYNAVGMGSHLTALRFKHLP